MNWFPASDLWHKRSAESNDRSKEKEQLVERANSWPLRRVTRRNLFKIPGLWWLSSFLARIPLAGANSPDLITKPRASRSSRRSMDLNGAWSLTYGPCPGAPKEMPQLSPPPEWPTITATVPGNVELDLVAAGRLEPLERGKRVYQALDLESYQWWHRRSFRAETANPDEEVELVFDGIDCLSTIWLNGELVGHTANMLIPHRFNVTALLRRAGENVLVVRIDPAVPAGRAVPRTGWEWAQEGHWESLAIRKAPHMYGWDIMPRIVSAGLWRGVRLEWVRPWRIESVYWSTLAADPARRKATVAVSWKISGTVTSADGYHLAVEIRRDGRNVFQRDAAFQGPSGQFECALENVDLWWPRGFGPQPLYDAVVTLRDETGAVCDQHVSRLGIRTIELDRTEIITADGKGRFGFVVNGAPIFIKGTNFTCLDALHSRDANHLDQVFPMLLELNCNMVRCWGGNVYPEDRFFDLCDQHGILVWQDFAMGCAVYPQEAAFLSSIESESRAVVTRLRNHPSLALWSGNNECDEAIGWAKEEGRAPTDPNLDRSTRETIPAVLKELDPNRSYLPSSPYHSPAVVAAGNKQESLPENHLWGPRGYFKAPFYTSSPARFVSEIGYHGCPSRSSLERMFDPELVHPWVTGHQWNDQWQTKAVRFSPADKSTLHRNDLMIKQIQSFFGAVPENLDDFILASQITQAEAMKFFVELFRQQKGFKQGIVWWNLRDGWPILSDAVVDYYNNRKLAFYYLQAVQRDVQAICCEAKEGQHAVVVANDTQQEVRGNLEISSTGESTAALMQCSFQVQPNGLARLGVLPHPKTTEIWRLRWSVEGHGDFASHYLAISEPVDFEQYKKWRSLPGLLPG